MFRVKTTLSCAFALTLVACSMADLRPEAIKTNQLPADAEAEGRAWLEKAAAAQGGDALGAKKTVSFWLRDEWPSALMRMMAMPWEVNQQLLRLDMVVGSDDGRLIFEEGTTEGTGWGLQNWVSYRFDKVGAPQLDAADAVDAEIKFWVPTLAYFPLLAWRIQEADYVRFVGDETVGDRTLIKVFATWQDAGPKDSIDQYIVWIDPETNLVAGVQYTVRDIMSWVIGTMKYSDYRSVDDVKLPFIINGVDDLSTDETATHRMVFERVAFDDGVTPSDLVPNPELRATK